MAFHLLGREYLSVKDFLLRHKKVLTAGVVVVLGIAGVFIWGLQQGNRSGVLSYVTMDEVINTLVPRAYSDVGPEHAEFTAISYLWKSGVLDRDDTLQFEPEQTVSRAEWASMLVRLADARPDPEKDRSCFPDARGELFELSACYAWRQGWMASEGGYAAPKKPSLFRLVKTVFATEEEVFAGNEPITAKAAIGSLARATSWTPAAEVRAGEITDEQAVKFAEQARIISPEAAASQTLSRQEGAGAVFKTLATVPFGAEEYKPQYDSQVTRRRAQTLADTSDKKTQSGPSREARIKHWAENSGIGEEAATKVVDSSSSHEEELAKVRQVRYQMRLAEEKRATWGKDTPTFNAFEPLREMFKQKGFNLTIDDVMMKTRAFDGEQSHETTNPVVRARDYFKIYISLDAEFNVIPRARATRENMAYVLEVDPGSFYDTGPEADFYLLPQQGTFVGNVSMEIVEVNTSAIRWAGDVGKSLYYLDRAENVNNMYERALRDLEVRSGRSIRPPVAENGDAVGSKDWQPVANNNRRVQTRPRTTAPGQPTSWGNASGWETAYENYFWVHIQHPDLYPSFWDFYNGTGGYNEYIKTMPLGEPVDLRAYFDTPGVKDYYKEFREGILQNSGSVTLPLLDDLLAGIDAYQANLDMAKPAERQQSASPPENEDTSRANAETEELLRWMRECAGRPLPETRAEWQEQLRQDMDSNSPCYNPHIKQCQDGSYGLCMEDGPASSGWVESR